MKVRSSETIVICKLLFLVKPKPPPMIYNILPWSTFGHEWFCNNVTSKP